MSLPNSHRYNLGGIFLFTFPRALCTTLNTNWGHAECRAGRAVWERRLPKEEEGWGEVQGQAMKKRELVKHSGENTGLDGTSESH